MRTARCTRSGCNPHGGCPVYFVQEVRLQMKLRLTALALVIALMTALAGCVNKQGTRNDPVTQPDGQVAFEQVAPDSLPADVKAWVAGVTGGQKRPITDSKTFGDKTWLLVYAGEKPSGGFVVRIDSVTVKDGKATVAASVSPPAGPATTELTYPMAVARMPRHDGQISFTFLTASTPIPEPSGGGRTGVKTGPFKIDLQAMQTLQEAVNQGHQPWRLDPLQVAMSESQQYGFDPKTDKFELTSKESGQALVQVRHGGALYFIRLVQPKGMTIWTISDIQPARQ